ncbi:MAG: glycosyltransferase [Puia sp.]
MPTYNNAGTLVAVLNDLQKFNAYIIVVNDGSTDKTENILDQFTGIHSISYAPNKGKGIALRRDSKPPSARGINMLFQSIQTVSILPGIFLFFSIAWKKIPGR